ncbi:MAG: 50S ribosomal protein L29 [Desulfobacterales bacterium]|nr:50S ribosomal protein L29 [Desulfobacterales bacterium]
MKTSEIREMTPGDRTSKVDDLKQELFNLRFQNEIGQLENPQKIKAVKRDIARLKTIAGETATT